MELRRLRGAGLASLPNSSTWLVTLAAVIEAAVELGDTDLAEEAAALLAPYANRPIMASLAVVCFGSVHYALGRAALAVGVEATAEHHLGEAVLSQRAVPATGPRCAWPRLGSAKSFSCVKPRPDHRSQSNAARRVGMSASTIDTHTCPTVLVCNTSLPS